MYSHASSCSPWARVIKPASSFRSPLFSTVRRKNPFTAAKSRTAFKAPKNMPGEHKGRREFGNFILGELRADSSGAFGHRYESDFYRESTWEFLASHENACMCIPTIDRCVLRENYVALHHLASFRRRRVPDIPRARARALVVSLFKINAARRGRFFHPSGDRSATTREWRGNFRVKRYSRDKLRGKNVAAPGRNDGETPRVVARRDGSGLRREERSERATGREREGEEEEKKEKL